MSSHEGSQSKAVGKSVKRRRIGRACDMCRIKKIRCDGEQVPGQRCTNCATYDEECTFVQSAPKRRSKPRGYVQRLEARVAAMEAILTKLCPEADLAHQFPEILALSSRVDNSDTDSSDDEFEESTLSANIDDKEKERDGRPSRKYSEAFAYALPPAFSPTFPAPAAAAQPLSPPTSGMSSPVSDAYCAPYRKSYPDSSASRATDSEDVHREDSDLEPSDDEFVARRALSRLTLDPHKVSEKRYFGKSSNIAILHRALEIKTEYAQQSGDEGGPDETHLSPEQRALRERIRFLDTKMRVNGTGPVVGHGFDIRRQRMRPLPCSCPYVCAVHPWARQIEPGPALTFPEPELMDQLLHIYFTMYNNYAPVLHGPLLFAAITDGLHLRDSDFGSVVLLACALGARFSDDPRVLLDEENEPVKIKNSGSDVDENAAGPSTEPRETSWHSAGWKWFRQVRLGRRALVTPPNMFDLQVACLASIYLRSSSAPEASRTITGVGLRIAQDIGAHRRKMYSEIPNEEQELVKRSFWVLVWLEWSISPALGRPSGIQYEDFDLDYPVECDDEYWVTPDPSMAFQQPPEKPSLIAFFNCMLRLNQIIAFAMRTIYSTNKSKALLGFVGSQWEERIVAELDSAMNAWIDSVPQHLRWDCKNTNTTFLCQSATLYAAYYTLQISVHRPFIPSPRKPARTSFPSLAICTNAARSCVHVLDTVFKRTGVFGPLHANTFPLFTSTIVLMLNMFGTDAAKTKYTLKEMEDINRAMFMLKAVERRWHTAGRLWDMLHELAIVGELPLLPQDPAYAHLSTVPDRRHSDPSASKSRDSQSGAPSRSGSRPRKHSTNQPKRRSSHPLTQNWFAGIVPDEEQVLPIRSNELGKLPLHPIFDADPSSAYNEYDLSPSVFNQPSTSGAAPASAAGPSSQSSEQGVKADPMLDSIFTVGKPLTRAPTPFIHAPQPVHVPPPPLPSLPPSAHTSPPITSPAFMLQQPEPVPIGDRDTLSMWSSAPVGFEYDDWGNYISNFASISNMDTSSGDFSGIATFGQPPNPFADRSEGVYRYFDAPM